MIRSLFLLLCTVLAATPAVAEQRLYLAAGGEITAHRIDPESGELSAMQAVAVPGAGPLAVSPDQKRLYAVAAEKKAGGQGRSPAIATMRIGSNGALEPVGTAPTNLRPQYLRTDRTGRYLAGSHYREGKASVWKLDEGVYRGETVQELALEKRAHCTVFSPGNRWLLVPATGPNKVFVNRFDAETGRLTPNDPPFATGPTGEDEARQPRHLIFHPEKPIAYTTNEQKQPGVAVWGWDAERGVLEPVQNIVTQPKGFEGRIATADLHLTPEARFLYISNRDVSHRGPEPGEDSIVGFRVDPETGRLTKIGHQPCERIPRSFTIDASGRFLYVAGRAEDRLGVYRIDRETGELSRVTGYDTGEGPIWVECVELR